MATLTGQKIKNSYKDLLQVSNSNSGIDATSRTVSDGEGTASPLALSTTTVTINGIVYPVADGTSGQAVITDGAGNLSFGSVTASTAMDDITDVVITAINVGEILKYNGSVWINNTLAEAGISAVGHTHTASEITDLATATVTFSNKSGNISQWTNDSGYITATLSDEYVQDLVGAMFTGNTETLITATYQDIDGTIDLVVNESSIDHNALTNYVANEHIDWTSTTSNLSTSGTAALGATTVTGNIIVTGTVDGRDVATDGTKLDGIEAGADVTDETNVVAALDGATLTAVTVAPDDKVLIQDTSDSDNVKTVTAQSIANLASVSAGSYLVSTYTAGGSITAGDVVYMDTATGKVKSATRLSLATSWAMGIAQSSVTLNDSLDVTILGEVPFFGSLSAGSMYYLSTGGTITSTVPTSGILVEVGIAVSSTTLLFNPRIVADYT